MAITIEMVRALAHLRNNLCLGPQHLQDAFQVLDDAGLFKKVDNLTEIVEDTPSIGHSNSRWDTRPAFGITYRRYTDVRSSFVQIKANNLEDAMNALTEYLGTNQYLYALTDINTEEN